MNVLDLFSGIGGFALGLESVGFQTVAFCEQDGYARRVLKKHWPETWIYEDIRTLTAKRLKADGIGPIDLICGGFPCQDISCAGKGAGIEGSRSGLWSEMHRIIREVKPRWVIAENVPALRCRGANRVLGDLETAGYTTWPLVVGALHAGAKHRRQRVWIVAHAAGRDERNVSANVGGGGSRRLPSDLGSTGHAAHPPSIRRSRFRTIQSAHALQCSATWQTEPDVGRVADGVPARVDRLRCLGNAVVPQVVAMIGAAILRWEAPGETSPKFLA